MQLKKTDLFTFIHKALRSIIFDSNSRIQFADFANKEESFNTAERIRQSLMLLHEHAEHEDNIIFPEINENEPGMVKVLMGEHKVIEEKMNRIIIVLNQIMASHTDVERLVLGAKLNNMYNDFAAVYLSHMNHEEATVLGASMKYLTDEELIAIRTRIQKKIPPERYGIWLKWMLKSLNNQELTGFISGMKVSASLQVLENVKETAQQLIPRNRWDKIKVLAGV